MIGLLVLSLASPPAPASAAALPAALPSATLSVRVDRQLPPSASVAHSIGDGLTLLSNAIAMRGSVDVARLAIRGGVYTSECAPSTLAVRQLARQVFVFVCFVRFCLIFVNLFVLFDVCL